MANFLTTAVGAIKALWKPTGGPGTLRGYEERIKTGPSSMRMPVFLPYFDTLQNLEETSVHRNAYRKMLADPDVKAAAQGKILSVAALEVQFHPAKKKDARSQELADFCDWQFGKRIKGGMFGIAWNVLAHALIDGYSVCNRVRAQQERGRWAGKHIIRELKPKDPNHDVVPIWDEYRNIVALRAMRYNQGEEFEDLNDFVIFKHLPLFGGMGVSDFRAAYSSWWYLDSVTKLRAMGSEKRYMPIVTGEYPDDKPEKQAALDVALSKLKSSNWLSVPKDVQIQVLDTAGKSDDFFAAFIRDCRERITVGIAGSLLANMQGGKGEQRGSSSVHKDTADVWKWALSTTLATVLNDEETGLIPDVIDRNFAGVDEYPTASFGGVDDGELGERLKIYAGIATALPSWQFDKEEVEETFGVKWCDEAANVVKAAPAAGTMPGAPPGQPFADPSKVPAPASGVPAPQTFRFGELDPTGEWTDYILGR